MLPIKSLAQPIYIVCWSESAQLLFSRSLKVCFKYLNTKEVCYHLVHLLIEIKAFSLKYHCILLLFLILTIHGELISVSFEIAKSRGKTPSARNKKALKGWPWKSTQTKFCLGKLLKGDTCSDITGWGLKFVRHLGCYFNG